MFSKPHADIVWIHIELSNPPSSVETFWESKRFEKLTSNHRRVQFSFTLLSYYLFRFHSMRTALCDNCSLLMKVKKKLLLVKRCDCQPLRDLLATGCADGIVRVWNFSSKDGSPYHVLTGHTSKIFHVRWHPLIRNILASGSDDRWVYELTWWVVVSNQRTFCCIAVAAPVWSRSEIFCLVFVRPSPGAHEQGSGVLMSPYRIIIS